MAEEGRNLACEKLPGSVGKMHAHFDPQNPEWRNHSMIEVIPFIEGYIQ